MTTRDDQRGSISIVVATGTLIFALCGAAAADLGSLLLARARAQTAADAAALAAAAVLAPVLSDADPLERAREAAEANGARLMRCVCARGDTIATVDVEVTARTMLVRAWDGRRARASARAEVDPDVYSYRG